MEKTAASLPEHLLELADAKGLVVEGGAVLFESDIGGGLLAHHWLTQQETGNCISTEILSPIEGGKDEYEELLPVSLSAPIDDNKAASVIERWGMLKQLELSFDSQMARKNQPRKTHDSGFENDNLD
jgi:hypothetical protein